MLQALATAASWIGVQTGENASRLSRGPWQRAVPVPDAALSSSQTGEAAK